jgi:hypothetical protein
MPYKNKLQKKEYRKAYYEANKEVILSQQKLSLQAKIGALSEEDKLIYYNERRNKVLKSYYKHRDKTLEKNRERSFKYGLKLRYNITYDTYLELLKTQNNKCAICGCNEFEKTWVSKKLPFAVDHCHTTGKIRGLLCSACNLVIGYAYDDTSILLNAIKYLDNGK